ncbi:MAG TPA: nucleotidyltransferase family protein [Solirubrobacteraceae bacterium]|jgi:dTDP-glucose pyrophosphorylase
MDAARLDELLLTPTASIRTAIERIDAGAIEIALVVDDRGRLLGTLTDGDVRRALLRGVSLDDPAGSIAHRGPVTAPLGMAESRLLAMMTEHGIDQVPLLGEDGRVHDVAFLRDLLGASETPLHHAENPVVLMAGGLGTRLRPLTESTPKPMLPVGDKPLMETVLGQIRDAGFSRVLISVNFHAEVIEGHFGDGSDFGVDITYLHEDEPLGTAGALRLAGGALDRPFVVMNADLLTNVKLAALMRFHREEHNLITVGVRRYALEVPYGVIELNETQLVAMREKPRLSFFVNAGIYAVEPAAMPLLPQLPSSFNMPDLVEAALARRLRVGGFPVREYWLDIGQLADYDRAHSDHATHFSVHG